MLVLASSLPQGYPVEPRQSDYLCPTPTYGISVAGRRRQALNIPVVLQNHVVFPVTAEVLMLCPGSTRVGDLIVAVLSCKCPVHIGALSLGLPGHNLVTRQCLGHQVPANAWAHCQCWPHWDILVRRACPLVKSSHQQIPFLLRSSRRLQHLLSLQ